MGEGGLKQSKQIVASSRAIKNHPIWLHLIYVFNFQPKILLEVTEGGF